MSITGPTKPIIDLSDSDSEFNPSQSSREASITTNVTGVTDPFQEVIIEAQNRQDKEEQDRKDALKAALDIKDYKENIPLEAEVLHDLKVKIEDIQRDRRSYIQIYLPNPNPNTIYTDSKSRIQQVCQYCPRRYLKSSSTHIITNHLRIIYIITFKTPRLADKKQKHSAIEKTIEYAINHPGPKRRRQELED